MTWVSELLKKESSAGYCYNCKDFFPIEDACCDGYDDEGKVIPDFDVDNWGYENCFLSKDLFSAVLAKNKEIYNKKSDKFTNMLSEDSWKIVCEKFEARAFRELVELAKKKEASSE